MGDDKVYVVRHTLISQGKSRGYHDTAMIYKDGIPNLVFEWRETSDGESSHYHVPLDPTRLQPLPGWKDVDYVYNLPVSDPRPHN